MKRALGFLVAVLLPVFIAGCGTGPAPTRPSTAPSVASIAEPAAAPAAPAVVPWSCVVQSASFRGIFAGAILETACPVRLGVQSRLFATAAPTAPPNLTSSVSGSTVTLTWLVPTSPDPATSYVIEAGSSVGSTNIAVLDTLSTSTSFTATGVPPGTYFVRVRARNSAGTSSASNEVVVIVGGGGCASAPGAPTGLTSSVSGSSVSLAWAAPSGGCSPTGYVIEAGSASGSSNVASFNTGSTTTTFSAGGVPAGTYYVRVRAANSNGQSVPSNEIVVVVGGSGTVDVTGRWVGLAPDGFIINDPNSCDAEHDITRLDLVQNGGSLTGTMTTRTRTLTPGQTCGQIGFTATASFTGTVIGAAVSWQLPLEQNRGTVTWSGTVSGNRMTGSLVGTSSTFAVTRQ